MTAFLSEPPKRETSWRAVVLFGRNVTSYKFSLAQSLLEIAEKSESRVLIKDLAEPSARKISASILRELTSKARHVQAIFLINAEPLIAARYQGQNFSILR